MKRRRKRKVGHCDNPWCGELDVLAKVEVRVDGRRRRKPQRLCRVCTVVTLERFTVHGKGWHTRYP